MRLPILRVIVLSLVALAVLPSCKLLKKKNSSTFDEAAPLPPPPPVPFTPPPVVTPPPIQDFSGVYVSNFGVTVIFSQVGTSVVSSLTAKHGRISCTAFGITLDCVWVNGSSRGREFLVKQPDGTLKGTFGNGSSSTGGGSISFFRKRV
jgi:hypothetical protein